MKNWKICIGIALAVGMAELVFAQGSLTPPGAPGATMKTLEQVEARTLISSVPYTITQPGSYYLSQNLTAVSGSGITVDANDVTLDLNGFTLDGAGTEGNGIDQGAAYQRLTIRNGKVIGWRVKNWYGIRLQGGEAVLEDLQLSGNMTAVSSAGYTTLRRCEAVGNNGDGFNLNQGMVLDCRAADNLGDGIEMASNGVVRASVCANNGKINIKVSGSGCTIEDNKLTGGETGIALQSGGNRIANNEVYGATDNYDLAQGNQLDLLLCEIPESIDWSASVKLAGSLESTGHGVVITSSDVTLDLMGFTLSGDQGTSDYGIFLDGATNSTIRNVTVCNGIVRNFDCGVCAEYTQDSRFEHLIASTNSTHGIYLRGASGPCDGNTIADCTIRGNASSGVYLYLIDGNTIANCTISGNGNYGTYFYLSDGNTIANCMISGNASSGICLSPSDGNTVADCTISGNAAAGIYLNGFAGQCDGNTLNNCTLRGNGTYGVYLVGTSGLCDGNTIADCTISENAGYGVYLVGTFGLCDGNTIADCTISGNGNYGVFLSGNSGQCDGNTIADCTIRKNAGRGIYLYYADGNRVEGNQITGQTGTSSYGIRSSSTEGNLIFRNTCVGQTNNFTISANDTYGPIVTSSGALSGTDPWANFSR